MPGATGPSANLIKKAEHYNTVATSLGCPALLLSIRVPAALVLPVRHTLVIYALRVLLFGQANESNLLSGNARHKYLGITQ